MGPKKLEDLPNIYPLQKLVWHTYVNKNEAICESFLKSGESPIRPGMKSVWAAFKQEKKSSSRILPPFPPKSKVRGELGVGTSQENTLFGLILFF